MANEIHIDSDADVTLYFLIYNTAGNVNDEAAGDGSFEAYAAANIADYDHALTENGDTSGHYVGSFDTNISAAGRYFIKVFLQLGGSVADGDDVVGSWWIVWSGSAEIHGFETDGGLTTAAIADVNAQADTALSDINLDHLLKVDTTVAADDDLESYVASGTVMAHLMAAAADVTAFKASTDSLEAIKVHADTIKAETAVINAFWNVFILVAGTIGATGNDTTHLHLTGLTFGDDELNDYLIVIYDTSEAEYHSSWITDWDNASALATVSTLAFTPQDSTDPYWVLATRKHPDVSTILANVATIGADRFVHHHTVIKEAKTDVTLRVLLKDTGGNPKTSQTITDLDIYYIRVETDNDVTISAKADLTALTALTDAHADNKGYEIGQGYYRIDVPDAAFATGAYRGTVIIVDGAGTILPTMVDFELVDHIQLQSGANEITYTVKEDDEDTGDPIDGVEVWIKLSGGTDTIWSGTTDANGVARDSNSKKPYLDDGTYDFYRKKSGYVFSNPDSETFS